MGRIHWIGLAAEYDVLDEEAITCFLHSVKQKRRGNKDYINLAELAFIKGDFGNAKNYSESYLRPSYPFVSALDAVAQFYFGFSEFMNKDTRDTAKMPLKEFRKKWNALDAKLEGTFASGDLTKYLDSDAFKKLPLTPEERSEVKLTRECFIQRIDCLKDSSSGGASK